MTTAPSRTEHLANVLRRMDEMDQLGAGVGLVDYELIATTILGALGEYNQVAQQDATAALFARIRAEIGAERPPSAGDEGESSPAPTAGAPGEPPDLGDVVRAPYVDETPDPVGDGRLRCSDCSYNVGNTNLGATRIRDHVRKMHARDVDAAELVGR